MEDPVKDLGRLRIVLETQPLAVLATQVQGRPYASLVAFAVSADLRRIVFVTSHVTTKYRNLSGSPSVSLLSDSCSHSVEDFSSACEEDVDATRLRDRTPADLLALCERAGVPMVRGRHDTTISSTRVTCPASGYVLM